MKYKKLLPHFKALLYTGNIELRFFFMIMAYYQHIVPSAPGRQPDHDSFKNTDHQFFELRP